MPRLNPAKVPWTLYEVVLCAGLYLLMARWILDIAPLEPLRGPGRIFLHHLLSNLPLIVLPVLIVGIIRRRILIKSWFSPDTVLRDCIVGLQLFVLFGLLNALAIRLHLRSLLESHRIEQLNALQFALYHTRRFRDILLVTMAIGVVTPICEEVFFRGFLYPALRRHFSAWPAIILSSGIFALFHADSRLWLTAFLLSLVATIVFEYSGSLALPILVHMGANLSFVVFLVDQGDLALSVPLALILGAFVLMNVHFFVSSRNLFAPSKGVPRRSSPRSQEGHHGTNPVPGLADYAEATAAPPPDAAASDFSRKPTERLKPVRIAKGRDPRQQETTPGGTKD